VPPTLTAAGPPSTGTVGTAYPAYSFTATGAPAPTFAISSGALPAGLTLSGAGLLSGTPTAAGSSAFTVTATNGVGADAVSGSLTLTIAAAPAPPSSTPPVPRGPTTGFVPPASPPAADGQLRVADAAGTPTTTLAPGSRTTLTASGAAPGSTVAFVVYSTPVVLGSSLVDATGTATSTVTLPGTLAPGSHTLVAFATAADGSDLVLSAEVTVTGRGDELAATGTDTTVPLGLGLVLLVVGGVLVAVPARLRPTSARR
jgi:hypothetical protein